MKWLKQKLASLMNRIAPLDESINDEPQPLIIPPGFASIEMLSGPAGRSLILTLSSGEMHVWVWSRGREDDVLREVAIAAASKQTGLDWYHAAMVSREIRETQQRTQ